MLKLVAFQPDVLFSGSLLYSATISLMSSINCSPDTNDFKQIDRDIADLEFHHTYII